MALTAAAETLRICDGCNDTIVAGDGALIARWGWRNYFGVKDGKAWKLLLCPECQPEEDE